MGSERLRSSYLPVLVVVVFVAVVAVVSVSGGAGRLRADAGSQPSFVESNVTEDTTWTQSGGPYRVINDVAVEEGATLTVEPGTRVEMAEDVTLTVAGGLDAGDQSGEPVTITAAAQDPTAGEWGSVRYVGGADGQFALSNVDIEYATAGVRIASENGTVPVNDLTVRNASEYGFRVEPVGQPPTVLITNSQFENVDGNGVSFARFGWSTGAVGRLSGTTISDSTFDDVGRHGIAIDAGTIEDTTIADNSMTGVNGSGVYTSATENRNLQVRGNEIVRGSNTEDPSSNDVADGIHLSGQTVAGVSVADNRIEDFPHNGITVDVGVTGPGVVRDLSVTGNHITNVSRTGFRFHHDRHTGNVLEFSEITISNNVIEDSGGAGFTFGSEYIEPHDWRIEGNEIRNSGGPGIKINTVDFWRITVSDNVVANNGESGMHVVTRRFNDSRFAGNEFMDNGLHGLIIESEDHPVTDIEIENSRFLDNAGHGLELDGGELADGEVVVRDSLIAGNGIGVFVRDQLNTRLVGNAIVHNTRVHDRSDAFVTTRIEAGSGIHYRGASGPQGVHLAGENDIYGNAVGLGVSRNVNVTAENNYWGHASGPYHESVNPQGQGDVVKAPTDKVDFVPFSGSRFRDQYTRPEASISAGTTRPAIGQNVTFDAGDSTASHGSVSEYRFVVEDATHQAQLTRVSRSEPTFEYAFEDPDTYNVSVVVENGLGVDSRNVAQVQVTAREPTPTPTLTATPTPTQPPENGGTDATSGGDGTDGEDGAADGDGADGGDDDSSTEPVTGPGFGFVVALVALLATAAALGRT